MYYKFLKTITVIYILFGYTYIFADTNISIKLDKTTILEGETFFVDINIETDSTGSLEIINIDGLNKFKKIGEKRSNQIRIINGKRFIKYMLQLSLLSEKAGNYIIGPTKLHVGNNMVESNTINLLVELDNSSKTLEEEINSEEKDIIPKEINNKNNFDDIKGIKNPNKGFYQYILFQIFVILLFIGLYIYKVFLKNKKGKNDIKNIDITYEKKKQIIKSLKSLYKNINSYTKSVFYEKLNGLFRDYFNILGIKNSDKLTLCEIKILNLDKSLISLFEKSYLNEFSDKKDIEEERQKIIDKLIKFIK